MVVLEVVSKVKVFHKPKNESEWVLLGGINPDERDHAVTRETSVYQCFMAEPLSVGC